MNCILNVADALSSHQMIGVFVAGTLGHGLYGMIGWHGQIYGFVGEFRERCFGECFFYWYGIDLFIINTYELSL